MTNYFGPILPLYRTWQTSGNNIQRSRRFFDSVFSRYMIFSLGTKRSIEPNEKQNLSPFFLKTPTVADIENSLSSSTRFFGIHGASLKIIFLGSKRLTEKSIEKRLFPVKKKFRPFFLKHQSRTHLKRQSKTVHKEI